MSEILTQEREAKLNLTDRAFRGLPIPWVKTSVESTLSKDDLKEKLDAVIAGNISILWEWKKGRFIDTSAGYYVYTLQLSDKTEMDVIFYSHTNHKVLVGFKNHFEELEVHTDKTLLEKIAEIYPLPVYTQDGLGWVRLIAV